MKLRLRPPKARVIFADGGWELSFSFLFKEKIVAVIFRMDSNVKEEVTRMWKKAIWAVLLIVIFLWPLSGFGEDNTSFFNKSLHFSGEGMRYWYEEEGGLMNLTAIPYDKLESECKVCHVRSCDKCHAKEENGKMVFSVAKAKELETCLTCHTRQDSAFKFDQKKDELDLHIAAGMNCSDCHKAKDVHGDGLAYQSMREPGAIKADCLDCHQKGGEGPALNPNAKHHLIHGDKLDCAACHVRSTMACYNCHFSRFMETKKRPGNFIPMKSWLLLVNYQEKVTSANAMSIVYEGKKFITYAPYFTHSIMAKGRQCADCHNNKAIQLIKAGKKVPVVSFKDGKIVSWQGVVPLSPDKLEWIYFNKDGEKWIPIKGEGKQWIQFSAYGKPLTEDQLKKLSVPFGEKRR
jgi:hypothetical protein